MHKAVLAVLFALPCECFTPAAGVCLHRPQVKAPSSTPVMLSDNAIDSKLIAADATLIFAFSFARKLCSILLSPDFPGWWQELQEPLSAEPQGLIDTLNFAGTWALSWTGSALVIGAYTPDLDEQSVRRVGPVGAGYSFGLACGVCISAALAWPSLLGDLSVPPALDLTLDNAEAAIGLGAGLIAWRALLAEASTPPR